MTLYYVQFIQQFSRSRLQVWLNKISCQLSVSRVNEAAACGWFAAERGRLQRISIDSWYAAHALSKCG